MHHRNFLKSQTLLCVRCYHQQTSPATSLYILIIRKYQKMCTINVLVLRSPLSKLQHQSSIHYLLKSTNPSPHIRKSSLFFLFCFLL